MFCNVGTLEHIELVVQLAMKLYLFINTIIFIAFLFKNGYMLEINLVSTFK